MELQREKNWADEEVSFDTEGLAPAAAMAARAAGHGAGSLGAQQPLLCIYHSNLVRRKGSVAVAFESRVALVVLTWKFLPFANAFSPEN